MQREQGRPAVARQERRTRLERRRDAVLDERGTHGPEGRPHGRRGAGATHGGRLGGHGRGGRARGVVGPGHGLGLGLAVRRKGAEGREERARRGRGRRRLAVPGQLARGGGERGRQRGAAVGEDGGAVRRGRGREGQKGAPRLVARGRGGDDGRHGDGEAAGEALDGRAAVRAAAVAVSGERRLGAGAPAVRDLADDAQRAAVAVGRRREDFEHAQHDVRRRGRGEGRGAVLERAAGLVAGAGRRVPARADGAERRVGDGRLGALGAVPRRLADERRDDAQVAALRRARAAEARRGRRRERDDGRRARVVVGAVAARPERRGAERAVKGGARAVGGRRARLGGLGERRQCRVRDEPRRAAARAHDRRRVAALEHGARRAAGVARAAHDVRAVGQELERLGEPRVVVAEPLVHAAEQERRRGDEPRLARTRRRRGGGGHARVHRVRKRGGRGRVVRGASREERAGQRETPRGGREHVRVVCIHPPRPGEHGLDVPRRAERVGR